MKSEQDPKKRQRLQALHLLARGYAHSRQELAALLGFPTAPEKFFAVRWQREQRGAETLGAVRHGPALLAGLVVCGQCGRHMQVRSEELRRCGW